MSTPGPWKIEYTADDDVIIVSDVTKVTVAADIATWADARMIVNTPDMLAALRLVRDHFNGCSEPDRAACRAIVDMVIAKAEERVS